MKTTFFSLALVAAAVTASSTAPTDCAELVQKCRSAPNANFSFCAAQAYSCKQCEQQESRCRAANNANMSFCSSQRLKCDANIPQISGNSNVPQESGSGASSKMDTTTSEAMITSKVMKASATATDMSMSMITSAVVDKSSVSSSKVAVVTSMPAMTTAHTIVAPAANTTSPSTSPTSTPPSSANSLTISGLSAGLVVLVAAALL